MNRLIDLHTHSSCSDGRDSPAELAKKAGKKQLALLALSDHDTVAGLAQARAEAKLQRVPFVPAVEISTRTHDLLHILGYNINPDNPQLLAFLAEHREQRRQRAQKTTAKLRKAGIDITYEEVAAAAQDTVSRAHIADTLQKKGVVHSRSEAFRKFLLPGTIGYVQTPGGSVRETLAVILAAGGTPVLAHPGVVSECWDFPKWVNNGLAGIEAFYPAHSENMTRNLLQLAQKYRLFATAGSDYHGAGCSHGGHLGVQIPKESFDAIAEKLLNKEGQ